MDVVYENAVANYDEFLTFIVSSKVLRRKIRGFNKILFRSADYQAII